VYVLGLASRFTGEEKYARAAEQNLLTVCDFPDWNPSHFLDTAEMSHAVGVGYDWLYDYLDPASRDLIRAALIEKGLKPGLEVYAKGGWWARSEHNWNQVCNSGMIVGALAIAETDPNYAERIVPAAIKSLPLAIKSYGPDGAWGEGPGYWSYATHYTAYGLTALNTALGSTFDLIEVDGLWKAGSFPVYTTGPTGLYLNFADVGERSARRPMPCMFWLARTFHNPLYAWSEHEQIAERSASAAHLVWYTAKPPARAIRRQLDACFRGPVEVVTLRSAWNDPNALFAGIKAGYNQVNHGHLDLGNFELDALGVRWAIDLGADNYNLPGYWNGREDGQRWTYYRLNSQSHNVCTFDGKDQSVKAKARVVQWLSRPDTGLVVIDLTEAYAHVGLALRGVQLMRKEGAVLVQDEFTLAAPRDLVWGMTTKAEILVEDDGSALLTQDGKQLRVHVLEPAGARFEEGSARREEPEATNEGFRRLLLPLNGVIGEQRVALLFVPVTADAQAELPLTVAPLADWPGDAVE